MALTADDIRVIGAQPMVAMRLAITELDSNGCSDLAAELIELREHWMRAVGRFADARGQAERRAIRALVDVMRREQLANA